METAIDLTISIISYNTIALLQHCLLSLQSSVDPSSTEICVVDNCSADGSSDMVSRQFPHVRILRNAENLGFARANNQAFLQSRGRYFLLLNSDTIVLPEAFEGMVRFMEEHKVAGAVAPRLLNPDGTIQASCFSRLPSVLTSVLINSSAYILFDRIFPCWNYPGRFVAPLEASEAPREVPHVMGACLLVRSSLYRELGMLDERFFLFREETDLCKRIRDAGWEIYYLPSSNVIHHGAASWHPTQEACRLAQGVESEWLYHRKHYGARAGNLLIVANLCAVCCSMFLLSLLVVAFFWHKKKRKYLAGMLRTRVAVLGAYVRLAKKELV